MVTAPGRSHSEPDPTPKFRRGVGHVARQMFRNTKAVLALLILPLLLAGIGVGVVRAVTVNGGTIGGFEADGNQVVDTAGHIDWAATSSPPRSDVVDDTADSGFTQGAED